jgi:PAS domain S-box-containing protein
MTAVPKSTDGSIDNVSLSVLVVHDDHTIRYANPAAHRMLGYRQGTLSGLSLEHLMPSHRRSELRNIDAVLAQGRPFRMRTQVLRADGRPIEVTFMIEPAGHEMGRGPAVTVSLSPVPPWGAREPVDSEEISLRHAGFLDASSEVEERIQSSLELLGWLEQRLSAPVSMGSLDDPSERERAQKVLADACAILTRGREPTAAAG